MKNHVKKAFICFILALVLLPWPLVLTASADGGAGEITDQCAYDLPEDVPAERLTDGSLLALGLDGPDMLVLVLAMALLLGVSLWQEKHEDALVRDRLAALPLALRWGIWLAGLAAVLILGVYGPGYSSAQFIYMAF